MKRVFVLFLVSIFALSGCATYAPTSAPIPQDSKLPISKTEGPLAVGVDPYTQSDRQKQFFGGDLNGAGVVPIQVLVRNEEDKTLLVRPSDALLVLPDGSQISPAGASAAAAKMESIGGVVGASIAFGIVGMLVASSAEDKARESRREDFKRKELQEGRLAGGVSAYGFLYFLPPPGTKPFDRADIMVRGVDIENASTFTVKLPLNGIDYKGN